MYGQLSEGQIQTIFTSLAAGSFSQSSQGPGSLDAPRPHRQFEAFGSVRLRTFKSQEEGHLLTKLVQFVHAHGFLGVALIF